MPRAASAECCCGFEMEGRPQPQERDGIARGQGERAREVLPIYEEE